MAAVVVPSRFNVDTVPHFMAQIVSSDGHPVDDKFVFDFSRLQFVEGDGLTVLGNTIGWLNSRDILCSFMNHTINTPPLRYMDDCGFFRDYLGSPISAAASVRTTTLPLRRIRHAQSFAWLSIDFTGWLAPKLNTVPAALADICTCIKELFNNIRDHSLQDTGYIHVQWHPNVSSIKIAISDFGQGIPASIASQFKGFDDGAAIDHATKMGVTTKSVPGNRGAGLPFLVDYVVLGTGGNVRILSGNGNAFYSPSGTEVGRRFWLGNGRYPGALFNIELRTDRLDLEDPGREDLEW